MSATLINMLAEFEGRIAGVRTNDDGLAILFEFYRRVAANAAEETFLALSLVAVGEKEAKQILTRRLDVLITGAAETHATFGLRGLEDQTVEVIVASFNRRLGDLALACRTGGAA